LTLSVTKSKRSRLPLLQGEESEITHNFVHDCKRFLMYARSGIEQAPLQTYVSAALFAPSGTFISDLGSKTTLVSHVKQSSWSPGDWDTLLFTLEGHLAEVTAVQFSPDGSKLASASYDDKVMVWDLSTGVRLHTLEAGFANFTALQFSPDGSKLASASREGNFIVWDLSTGGRQPTLDGYLANVTTIQLSPGGSKLASASHDRKVMVWDVSTGGRQHTLEGNSVEINILQFSRDGSKLASASHDGKVMVWDVSTGRRQHTLEGHTAVVTAVQFSADGIKLASASHDGEFMVWDLSSNSPIEKFDVRGYVSDLAFSADGFYLKTNIGSFKLKSSVGSLHDCNASSLHLQVQEDWILRHEHRTIWLPPDFRPHQRATSVHGAFVAFGHLSGTVSLWEIRA
jgi:WD40 repeat protein